MEIKKININEKEYDFIVSSDDEVEKNDEIVLNDTLDLTDTILDIKNILESSGSNE